MITGAASGIGRDMAVLLADWGAKLALGFYPWDYCALSEYRMYKRGYTLWTLVPLWGVAGMLMEQYARLMLHLSPHVAAYIAG